MVCCSGGAILPLLPNCVSFSGMYWRHWKDNTGMIYTYENWQYCRAHLPGRITLVIHMTNCIGTICCCKQTFALALSFMTRWTEEKSSLPLAAKHVAHSSYFPCRVFPGQRQRRCPLHPSRQCKMVCPRQRLVHVSMQVSKWSTSDPDSMQL